jgi:glycosyltransferase involved in cell wall biosynthesis
MARKRLLMACPNYWLSTFQVGSHHLARAFVRAGWDVAFLSDPISPLHLCEGLTPDLKRRLALWQAGGRYDLDGRLWTYIPAALLTPHNKPLLRSHYVHRHWHRWTWPDVTRTVRRQGFGKVDLLYLDSPYQSFWLDAITYRQAVYRIADYHPHYAKYTAAARACECAMAQRVDLVAYPSHRLKDYARELGARRMLYLPNGVPYEQYAGPRQPVPREYRNLAGPIAVYMGVIPAWFHFAWVREAARRLPEVAFVLVGPDQLARSELGGIANIHILGMRDNAAVPAYLQHADVGLIPFDLARNPQGVEVLNPQKLYAYLASGLPVVSSAWKEIQELGSPARVCTSVDEFVTAIRQAIASPGDAGRYRRYAAGFDWGHRVATLLGALQEIAGPAPAAGPARPACPARLRQAG